MRTSIFCSFSFSTVVNILIYIERETVWQSSAQSETTVGGDRSVSLLKWQCHEIFLCIFPPMDPILINRLKWFAERFVFVEIFKFKVQKIGLCTVFVCTESTPHSVCLHGVDSAQCWSARSRLRTEFVCAESIPHSVCLRRVNSAL